MLVVHNAHTVAPVEAHSSEEEEERALAQEGRSRLVARSCGRSAEEADNGRSRLAEEGRVSGWRAPDRNPC